MSPIRSDASTGPERELPKHSVSVIMPNHNHASLLARAVQAHLTQTLPPHEIIIIDDASDDDSLIVASELERRHPTVKLLRHQVKQGPNAGIKTGLDAASGEYVTFAAADDIVHPDFLRLSIEALSRHPSAAFSFLDPSYQLLGSDCVVSIPLALSSEPRYFLPDDLEKLLRRNFFTISSNTVVYRRDAISNLGGFRVDLEWQADWMANLVLAFRHGAVYLPEALAHFVVNPNGYGESNMRSAEGQRRLLYRCIDLLECDYADVADRFRQAGLIPEMRIRNLYWLTQTVYGRRFISWHLTKRLLLREAWTRVRPFTPIPLRRWMRRRVAGN